MSTLRPRGRPVRLAALVAAAALALAACGDDDPGTAASAVDTTAAVVADTGETTAPGGATVENCGTEVVAGEPPQAAVTMNQAATEVMLSLGLADHVIGTAYLDDAVLPSLEADYSAIPVVAEEYPSREVLLELEPDFVYASYPSAFGEEVAGDRDALARLGIGSYLSPSACPDALGDDEPLTFDVVFDEISEVAALFGVPDVGQRLVADQQEMLDRARFDGSEDLTVFWWDGGVDSPTAGVCCGPGDWNFPDLRAMAMTG